MEKQGQLKVFSKQKQKPIQIIITPNQSISSNIWLQQNPSRDDINTINLSRVEKKKNDKQVKIEDLSFEEPSLKDRIYQCLSSLYESPICHYIQIFFVLLFFFCCILESLNLLEILEKIGEYTEIGCQIFFFLYLVLRITSCHKNQGFWIALDLLTIGAGCAAFIVTGEELNRYLKAFRTLKLLFIFKLFESLKNPVLSFLKALRKAGKILLPAMCLVFIYSVIGLFSFVDFEYNKCRHPSNKHLTSEWTVLNEEVFLCGSSRSCPEVSGVQYECLNPLKYNVEPNQSEIDNFTQGYGILTYSNIGYALLSTFKNVFVTGSSRTLVLYMHTLNITYVAVYFYSFIFLIPYIYLNIFYGLLMSSVSKESEAIEEEPEQSEINQKVKGEQEGKRIQRQRMRTYKVTVMTHKSIFQKSKKNIFFFEKLGPPKKKPHARRTSLAQAEQNNTGNKLQMNNIFEAAQQIDMQSEPSHVYQEKQSQQEKILREAYESYFYYRKFFTCFNVIVCAINLTLDFGEQSSSFQFVVDSIDCVLLILLLVEICIKVIVEKIYLQNITLLTKVDILIAMMCIGGMGYEGIIAGSFKEFIKTQNTLTSLIRNMKYLRLIIWVLETDFFSEEDKKLLLGICKAVYAVRYFMVVWLLVIIILSIMGFHLHNGHTLVNQEGLLDLQNGRPHQISFDGIYRSFIFTILTAYDEQWDALMLEEYPGCGMRIVIWQLIVVIIGLILFSKYLMCLIAKQLEDVLESIKQEKDNDTIEEIQFVENNRSQICRNINSISPVSVIEKANKKLPQPEPGICKTKVKELIRKIVDSFTFSVVKVITILIVCVTTATTNPTLPTTHEYIFICRIVTGICALIFLFQFLAVALVHGLWSDPEDSYFNRNKLNYLNIFILILELLAVTPLCQFHLFYRIEKLRALRALNLIQLQYYYDWNMKIILRSLWKLLPKFLKLFFFVLMIYYFFALIFNKWHKNDFFYCDNAPSKANIIVKEDCLNWGGDWIRAQFNCFSSLHSFIYMFLVVSMEGWIVLMTFTMNLSGKDRAPEYNASQYNQLFFSMFFFFGNLVILNIFISLSLYNFKKLKDEETGFSRISEEEKEWLAIKLQITRMKPQKKREAPKNLFRNLVYQFCTHISFTILRAIFFFIFLGALSVESTYWNVNYRVWITYIKEVFAYSSLVEYFLELIAYGFRKSKNKWVFETFTVIYSFGCIIAQRLSQVNEETSRILGGIFITLQFIRYISLLDQIPFTSRILNTLMTILPRSLNIFLVMLLFLYLSAIIGMELFAFLRPNTQIDGINQHYRDFGMALLSLLKFSILQSPIAQIQDTAHTMKPNRICFDINNYEDFEKYGFYGCGKPTASYLFFFSFHVFYTMFLMSTFLAFIVDTYSDIQREQQSDITVHVLQKVNCLWYDLDPEATGFIPYREFWRFTKKFIDICSHEASSQKSIEDARKQKENFLKRLNLRIYQNQCGVLSFQFHEVIKGLTRIYLEDYKGYRISELQLENALESELKQNLGIKSTNWKSSNLSMLLLLKAGLKNWRYKSVPNCSIFHLPRILREKKKILLLQTI